MQRKHKQGFVFCELDKLVPKSTWIRKRLRTGLIQEKQGKFVLSDINDY